MTGWGAAEWVTFVLIAASVLCAMLAVRGID
jgi:hypothetical protein